MPGDLPRTNEMHCSHFVIEDNQDPLFRKGRLHVTARTQAAVRRRVHGQRRAKTGGDERLDR